MWGQKHLFLPYTMTSISKFRPKIMGFFFLYKQYIIQNKPIKVSLSLRFLKKNWGELGTYLTQIFADLDGKNALCST